MQKLYYSISQVSELVDEEQHILRYWEKEFEQLKPKKNRGGNRIFSEKDVYVIKLIKKLLRSDKLSLKGAKENLDKILSENINTLDSSVQNIVNLKQEGAKNKGNEINSGNYVTIKKEELHDLLETLNSFSLFLEKY